MGLDIEYALPVSALRFGGTVSETEDTVLGGPPIQVRDTTVVLDVVAGRQRYSLRLQDGWIRDTAASFQLTDDGRLISAGVESTGRLGKVVLGVASLAANVAGMLAGVPPGALAAFMPEQDEADAKLTPEERIATAYTEAFPEVAQLRTKYEVLVSTAVTQIADLAEQLLGATDHVQRSGLLSRLWLLEQQLPVWRAELARLEAHFSAWRAGTLISHTAQHDHVMTLDDLRAAGVSVDAAGNVSFNSGQAAAGEAERLWELFGLVVSMDPEENAGSPEQHDNENVIFVREPRVVTLTVYERGEDSKARVQRTVEQLVIDSASPYREVKLEESWFAKRSGSLTFSPLGALTGISHSATSSAAELADTMGGLPGTVATSLEQAQKIRTAWATLQSSGLDQQLAKVKKQVELKQQQLTATGLSATEGQSAELERLKQQAEILAQRKAIGDAGLDDGAREITALKQQVDLLKGQKDFSEASRSLTAEHELFELRLEIERLKAEKEKADNQPPAPPTG